MSVSSEFKGIDPALGLRVQSCPANMYQAPTVSWAVALMWGTLEEESRLGSSRVGCFCQSTEVILGT